MDYVDAYLIHWPLPAVGKYGEAWAALENIYARGLARVIGVCNFQVAHLGDILRGGSVVPAINQIELHPYLTQEELRRFDDAHGITTMAWSPLGRGQVLADPVINGIARRHDVSAAQVIIRWHLQRGDIVIPKSATPARIVENHNVYGFALSSSEMNAITGLHRDQRFGTHPDHENRTDR